MSRREISFSAAMAAAILRGDKSETRRTTPPRWRVGDVLSVLEPIRCAGSVAYYVADRSVTSTPWRWKSSGLPGRFMPRALVRQRLRVLDLWSESLHALTDDGARREGIASARALQPLLSARAYDELLRRGGAEAMPTRSLFAIGWDAVVKRSAGARWLDNPNVYVTRFERV